MTITEVIIIVFIIIYLVLYRLFDWKSNITIMLAGFINQGEGF